jgi:hypothetical protein
MCQQFSDLGQSMSLRVRAADGVRGGFGLCSHGVGLLVLPSLPQRLGNPSQSDRLRAWISDRTGGSFGLHSDSLSLLELSSMY